ncbi:DNA-3-methyladenine glycosylase [Listeria sp. PSOL-1]|uniref:DNA-3-methyladenine glycosylase n=1 Tax=Listeria sp. PSOL-1 TaxID=1844999 RepID=UPI0013D20F8A|nr:DNA-3-methyladenine glycosylase [Listeria sp. PSOL-1]
MTSVEQLFSLNDTILIARDLLGMKLVHEKDGIRYAGLITETEAYLGSYDRAAHSYKHLRTKRTEIMFQEAGFVYMYHMHQQVLLNFITMQAGIPEAVLIRGLEPVENMDQMIRNRKGKSGREITNGPGKLTKALALTMDDYGKSLFSSNIWLESGKTPENILATERIGIPNKELATFYPLRFIVSGNPYVSGRKMSAHVRNGWASS